MSGTSTGMFARNRSGSTASPVSLCRRRPSPSSALGLVDLSLVGEAVPLVGLPLAFTQIGIPPVRPGLPSVKPLLTTVEPGGPFVGATSSCLGQFALHGHRVPVAPELLAVQSRLAFAYFRVDLALLRPCLPAGVVIGGHGSIVGVRRGQVTDSGD